MIYNLKNYLTKINMQLNVEILDKLTEGKRLTQTITYVPSRPNVIRTSSVYRTSEEENYQDWQSAAQRYVKTYHDSDLEDVKEASKKMSPGNHRKILGVLRAIKILPIEPPKSQTDRMPLTNNIQITNNQNISQEIAVNLFLEVIKDDLTGRDLKEIKEILKEWNTEPVKTKNKLIEKIKGFGGDVLSNIVANILTSPSIYKGLM